MTHGPAQSRRAILTTIGVTLTGITAGCLDRGESDADITNNTDSDLERNLDTETETRAPTISNEIPGFEINDTQHTATGLEITVTNTGDVDAELIRYEFKAEFFDANGDALTTLTASPGDVLAAGETRTVTIPVQLDTDRVAWYDVTVSCLPRGGVYCD